MIVRIVPHYVPLCDNSTWWKVQVRVTWLRIGRFRLWRWKTIGDYSFFDNAKIIVKTIVEVDMINKGSTK